MAELSYIRLTRDLKEPIPDPTWPHGVCLKTFTDTHAHMLHALIQLAYAKGGGSVGPFEQWWKFVSTDAEYDPCLCFTVIGPGGDLIGAMLCWTSAFIKDFAVHPAWRGRGIGTALLLFAFSVFRTRGAQWVSLKVQIDNPSGAIRLYKKLGMVEVAN